MARVGALAIVGMTVRSMRSMMPASSSRRNRSSSEVAAAAACIVSATMPRKTAGSGWTTARFIIHGSRGRTQQIASGSTPRASSQMQASVAVLPDPTMTYWLGASLQPREVVDRDHPGVVCDAERRRRLRRDVGGQVVGVDDPARASGTSNRSPEMRETTVRSPTYSLLGKNSTLPDSSIRSEHVAVVGADLGGSPLLQARLGSALLQRPPPSSVDATP